MCIALYFVRLGNFGILEGGESYYPAACREMIKANEWIVPQLNYQIYFSKPIMTFWLINSAYVLFGVTELAGRLWSSALCTVLVCFCYFTTRTIAGIRPGMLSALMLASSPLMVATCRRSSIDAYFSVFFGTALLAMMLVLFTNHKRWWPLIWMALSLSVLTKGPAGLVLFAGGLVAYLIFRKSNIKQIAECLRDIRVIPGACVFLAILLPWCVAVDHATKGLFLKVFVLYENLSRFSGNTNSGKHPHWWIYFPALAYGVFPWSLFIPASFIDALGVVKEKYFVKPGAHGTDDEPSNSMPSNLTGVMLFSLAYVLTTVVFFSMSRTQFDRYILPIWCPLVIMLSLTIERWLTTADMKSAAGRTEKIVSPFLALIGIACSIAAIVAATMFTDIPLWMRFVAPLGAIVLAVGWAWQFLALRRKQFEKSIFILALSTCAGFAVLTPVLFEYWYLKTYADVHELVKSVANTDADVGQYKEFMPSLLYYRKGPVFFFYHLSQLIPRKRDDVRTAPAYSKNGAPPIVPVTPRRAADTPTDPRLFILVKKDFEHELLAQPQLQLHLNSRRGEWAMYETDKFTMEKPPTLEESFNRLNWKDSMTDKFGFGPLTVPYSGGYKLWLR